ncbi:MAG: hypothetical protein CVT77_15140 [Alphaproteobacteria bacterium HGW-Alphaproteobacteria-16]|nr:MAG: hypothetical protein CVT77_15140 [Alphaproteobacteria bacterium HGW-Alphaproteobacteria-16]
MIGRRIERDAEAALNAVHRAWATEGDFALSPSDLADRVGYKPPRQVEQPVIEYMLAEGWITQQSDGVRLTDAGRAHSHKLIESKRR